MGGPLFPMPLLPPNFRHKYYTWIFTPRSMVRAFLLFRGGFLSLYGPFRIRFNRHMIRMPSGDNTGMGASGILFEKLDPELLPPVFTRE